MKQKHHEHGTQPLVSITSVHTSNSTKRTQSQQQFHDKFSVLSVVLWWWKWAKRTCAEVFLPVGFPDSVSDDYWEYQKWDTLQALCSSLSNTLAGRAVLETAGVGNAGATVGAAMMQWLLRDGTGMIGRILFARWQGRGLDSNAKQWRLAADALDDVSRCVQLLTPLLPQTWQLTSLCVAGAGFSIVGVAGGATRASLTQHQAQSFNMADVSAKDSSQETAVNLIALIISLCLLPILDNNPSRTLPFILFLLFAVLHVMCNYQACRSVHLHTLNPRRLCFTVQSFAFNPTVKGVPTPRQAAAHEDLLLFPIHSVQDFSIGIVPPYLQSLWVRFQPLLCVSVHFGALLSPPLTPHELQTARDHSAHTHPNHLVVLRPANSSSVWRWYAYVVFSAAETTSKSSNKEDEQQQLCAFFHMALFKTVLAQFARSSPLVSKAAINQPPQAQASQDDVRQWLYHCVGKCGHVATSGAFHTWLKGLETVGWDTKRHDVLVDGWTVEWDDDL